MWSSFIPIIALLSTVVAIPHSPKPFSGSSTLDASLLGASLSGRSIQIDVAALQSRDADDSPTAQPSLEQGQDQNKVPNLDEPNSKNSNVAFAESGSGSSGTADSSTINPNQGDFQEIQAQDSSIENIHVAMSDLSAGNVQAPPPVDTLVADSSPSAQEQYLVNEQKVIDGQIKQLDDYKRLLDERSRVLDNIDASLKRTDAALKEESAAVDALMKAGGCR